MVLVTEIQFWKLTAAEVIRKKTVFSIWYLVFSEDAGNSRERNPIGYILQNQIIATYHYRPKTENFFVFTKY